MFNAAQSCPDPGNTLDLDCSSMLSTRGLLVSCTEVVAAGLEVSSLLTVHNTEHLSSPAKLQAGYKLPE